METIKDKIRQSTNLLFNESLSLMVQFGIIGEEQKQIISRILDDFRYGKKVLRYDSLDVSFRYNPELFDKVFLDKVGNPERYKID